MSFKTPKACKLTYELRLFCYIQLSKFTKSVFMLLVYFLYLEHVITAIAFSKLCLNASFVDPVLGSCAGSSLYLNTGLAHEWFSFSV